MKGAFLLGSALLGSLAAAVPMEKRAYVYKTVTQEIIETVEVTCTVWVKPPHAAPPASSQTEGAFYEIKPSSSRPQAAEVPSSSSSSVVVPAYTPPPPPPPPVYTPPPSSTQAPTSVYTPPYTPPAPPAPPPPPPPPSTPSPPPSGGGGGQSYTGDLTWYDTGMGSCGIMSGYDDKIVAISHIIMTPKNGGNPNTNPLCGKTINISYGGKTYQGTVVDTCPGCEEGDLDMSKGFFDLVTNYGDGRVHGATWSFA